MSTEYTYTSAILWTGNRGEGTKTCRGYDRTWEIRTPGKPLVSCSNAPLLGGDPTLHNPEDLLLSALASCHMLWYLHLASTAGIAVTAYEDAPEAVGEKERSRPFSQRHAAPENHGAGGHGPEEGRRHPPRDPQGLLHRPLGEFPVRFEATYVEG